MDNRIYYVSFFYCMRLGAKFLESISTRHLILATHRSSSRGTFSLFLRIYALDMIAHKAFTFATNHKDSACSTACYPASPFAPLTSNATLNPVPLVAAKRKY